MTEEFNFITGASIEPDGDRWAVVLPGAMLEIRDTLAEALDLVETVTQAKAADCADTLRRIRKIRVERGLGRLAWVGTGYNSRSVVARVADGLLIFEVRRPAHDGAQWLARTNVDSSTVAWCQTEREAKAVCEQWYREWLDRAGLEVRK